MHEYFVKSINTKESCKIVTLGGNGKDIKLKLHRYSVVGHDDRLLIGTALSDKVFVKTINGDKLQVQPHFEYRDNFKLGDLNLEVRITELVTEIDLENYSYLVKYHYKSISNLGDETEEVEVNSGGGRKSILLLYVKLPNRWEAVGYIELQMPLMMCKPRHELFKNPYNNTDKQISWEKWDQEAIRNYVNQIVRIARVVTSPEFRGLSLSKYLIKAAKEFSIDRWHIKGKPPIFMEISAEMLKYIDFVSNAGFFFVGQTEGNISRVCKDLTYMNRGYNVSSGIMSLQKKYLTNFKAMTRSLNLDFIRALKKLSEICNSKNIDVALNKLKLPEYYLYKSVLRLPIPYYLMPLDNYSHEYLVKNIAPKTTPAREVSNKEILTIKSLNITASYNLRSSKYVRAILSGFGLKGDKLNQKIISDFSLTASPGNVVFVSGVSGTGKSVLLNLLNKKGNSQLKVNFGENNIRKFKISRLENIKSTLPLIEFFSKSFGIERSLSALNRAGLSEAFVYLKPYSLLSKGQQYRARFAKLILEDADIWLLDEFCSDLDVLTAKIVSSNLKQIVNKYAKIAIVAAANHEHFIDALKPTQVAILSSGKNSRVISYKDYKNELFQGNKKINKVFDKSNYLVVDPLAKVNTSAKGSNVILGSTSYGNESSLIYLGKVIENSTSKNYLANDVWLDVKFPHVIYITGTRGSGKSFDLGVLLEGISELQEESDVQFNIPSMCSFLIDTQSQFWTLKYKPNSKIDANKQQLSELKKWNLSENQLKKCQLWRVSEKDIITGEEKRFQIRPNLVKHEEWCEILDIEIYGPQGYALNRAIESLKGKNYSLTDIINYIRIPANLQDIQGNSKSALIYKLEEYENTGLFSIEGVEISDLLVPGQCNVFLLRDLRDVDKSLVACVLARQLFTFMGEYHKQKKVSAFFDKKNEVKNIPNKVWLVIDEAHVVAPNNKALPAREALVEFVKRGRDAGLSLVLATQQPSAIDDRILSQVNISISHRLAFQSDIQASMNRVPTQLIKKMKVSGVEISDYGDMIRYLDAGECFIGDNSTSRTLLIQIRPRITSHGGYSPI